MKKVLLIAYSFPPLSNIGSQRPYRLAKYFPQTGWEPIVLTVKRSGEAPKGIRMIETDYKDLLGIVKSMVGFDSQKGIHEQLGVSISKNFKYTSVKSKLIKIIKEIIAFPDEQRGWYKYGLIEADNLLKRERIDAIISTSYPVTAHLIARKLKKRHGIPWIADLRDPWTQNPYVNKFSIVKYFEKKLELKTLSDADIIVAVTDLWVNVLKILHVNKKIICVTNGYDETDFPKSSIKLTDKFTITYAGTLYNGKRDPSMLFEVLERLISENKINKALVQLRFYGPKEEWLIDEIKKYHLENVVNVYGHVSKEDILERQKESQLLLLLLWNNKNEEGFCPGKIYDYFGARRPIIAIGWPGSVVENLLEITNAGKFAWNAEMLTEIINDYYNEFIKTREVKCHSNSTINNYNYRSISKQYSQILYELIPK